MDSVRLTPSHLTAYRALMLEAYANHPDAFTSLPEERAELPMAWWEKRLSDTPDALQRVYGVWDEATLGGVAGLRLSQRAKERHKASVFGMYVKPDFRGQGIGRMLLDAVLDAARACGHVRVVQLTVTEGNTAALRLYQNAGFVSFGTEPYAIAYDGRFLGKTHLWRLVARGKG